MIDGHGTKELVVAAVDGRRGGGRGGAWWSGLSMPRPFARSRARRAARGRLETMRVELERALVLLGETEHPALRSQLMARAAVLHGRVADALEEAFGSAEAKSAAGARAVSAFLRALTAAEFSRSSGRVRLAADWWLLERMLRGVLDQLADVTLVEPRQVADVYALVCAQAESVLPAPFRDEVFAAVRRAYAVPAGEGS